MTTIIKNTNELNKKLNKMDKVFYSNLIINNCPIDLDADDFKDIASKTNSIMSKDVYLKDMLRLFVSYLSDEDRKILRSFLDKEKKDKRKSRKGSEEENKSNETKTSTTETIIVEEDTLDTNNQDDNNTEEKVSEEPKVILLPGPTLNDVDNQSDKSKESSDSLDEILLDLSSGAVKTAAVNSSDAPKTAKGPVITEAMKEKTHADRIEAIKTIDKYLRERGTSLKALFMKNGYLGLSAKLDTVLNCKNPKKKISYLKEVYEAALNCVA